jgi:cytochrome P450
MDPDRRAALALLERIHQGMMLFNDPPNHTRPRGLVSKAFTPRVVDMLRSRVQLVVAGLLAVVVPAPRFCVGAPLARLEGQIALASLLARFPNLHLTDEHLAYQPTIVFRALRSMPVAW